MNSSKFILLTMLTIAFSLSVSMTVSIVDKAYAGSYPYEAPLSGQNEVPPVPLNATGEGEFKALQNGTIGYKVEITGISGASAAHIHQGKAGENGEIIADLLNTPTSKDKDTAYGMIFRGNLTDSSLKGSMQGKTMNDLVTAMDSGETYVNVHTTEYPDGAIRGQIINTDKPASATNSTLG
ncbi:MAG: CHRD domain-containing protein [Nitrososphaerota archaeon]